MAKSGSFKTNEGKIGTLSRAYTDSGNYQKPSKFKVRYDGDLPNVNSTNLGAIFPVSPGTVLDNMEATTGWTTNGTNTIGLNNTINRTKGSALYVEKADNTVTLVEAEKTFSSFDFSTEEFWMFLFLSQDAYDKLTSAGVTIELRENASNYYSYDIPKTDMIAGWNEIYFDSSSATAAGTPTDTNITIFNISGNTTNTTDVFGTNDFVFDNLRLITDSEKEKDFVAGYPSISPATREATMRAYLTSVEAIGANVDGIGYFSDDDVLWGVDYFPAESKGIADEFNFIRRDRHV